MNIIMGFIQQFLGGGVNIPKLIELLKERFENHDGKLDLPDGLLPKEIETAIETALNSGNFTNLPIKGLDNDVLKQLMSFLEKNK